MTTPSLENLTAQKRVAKDAGLLPIDLSTLARINPTTAAVGNIIQLGNINYLGQKHSALLGYISVVDPTPSTRFSVFVGLTNLLTSNTTFLAPWAIKNNSPPRGARFQDDAIVQTNNLINGTNCRKTGIWHGVVGDIIYVRVRHFTNAIFSVQYEYDIRLHQDGRVEFGYAPLDEIVRGEPESPDADELVILGVFDATSGVAAQNSAQPLTARDEKYGSQLYLQPSVVYASRIDWPAPIGMGATYTLTSLKQTRKVLPRLQIREDDSKARIDGFGLFDDMQSAAFVEQPVNFPTTLPRLFGQNSTKGPPDVDLYTGMDLVANINPSSFGDWIPRRQETIAGFSEVGLYDQDHKYDAYYSGTLASDVGTDGFSGWLGQKDKIVLEYDIEFPTQLDPYSASLLYFDTRSKTFKEAGEKSNPRDYFTVHGDAKLFTAFGTMVMSGGYGYPGNEYSTYYDHCYDTSPPPVDVVSTNPFKMSDPWSYRYFTDDRINRSFQHTLIESPTIGKKYSFNENDTLPISFHIPGDQKFLVENVVIEMPFESGPGWRNDTTLSNIYMYGYGSAPVGGHYTKIIDIECIDVGGPCITVGLIKETKNDKLSNYVGGYDENYSPLRRDIICSGTLIPPGDYLSPDYVSENITVGYPIIIGGSSFPVGSIRWIANRGYKAHVGEPTAILHNATGSVKFEMKPGFSSLLYHSYGINDLPPSFGGFGIDTSFGGYDSFQNNPIDAYGYGKEYLDLFSGRARMHGSKPHGSSMSGPADQFWLTPSRQMEPPSRLTIDNKQSLYAKNIAFNFADTLSSSLNANASPTYYVQSGFVGKFTNNPYLLSPNDKLTVFISKFRSAKIPFEVFGQPIQFENDLIDGRGVVDIINSYKVRLAAKHDVKVASGKLKITLYGSYVGENKEKHPISKVESTTATSVTIGEEPVLDQFDLTSPQDKLGTYYNDVMGLPLPDYNTLSNNYDFPLAAVSLARKRVTSKTFGVNPYFNTDNRGSYVVPGVNTGDTTLNALAGAANINNPKNYYLSRTGNITATGIVAALYAGDYLDYCLKISNFSHVLGQSTGAPAPCTKIFCNEIIDDSRTLDKQLLLGKIGQGKETITFTFGGTSILTADKILLDDPSGEGFLKSFPYEYANNNSVDLSLTCDKMPIFLETSTDIFVDTRDVSPTYPTYITPGDAIRVLYGFCMSPNIIESGISDAGWSISGPLSVARYGPVIRGWRYGMDLGKSLPSCAFSTRHYGHLRDMLEQRPVTTTSTYLGSMMGKLTCDVLDYATPWKGSESSPVRRFETYTKTESPVEVKFLIRDTDGKYLKAKPEETSSGNLDVFYRSYAPFIEDQTRDRDYTAYPLLDLSYIVVSP